MEQLYWVDAIRNIREKFIFQEHYRVQFFQVHVKFGTKEEKKLMNNRRHKQKYVAQRKKVSATKEKNRLETKLGI